MKRVLLFFVAVMTLSSCHQDFLNIDRGNGVSVTTSIDVDGFNSISIPDFVDVRFSQASGDETSVSLTCDENLVDCYKIRVREGALVVETRSHIILKPKVTTYVTVSAPVLNSLKLSGSGDCIITGDLTVDGDFSCKTSGSGDISMDDTLSCVNFTASASGSGDIFFSGIQAQTSEFKTSGSGNLRCDELTSDEIHVTTTGSGNITLTLKDSGNIYAKTTGSGDIILKGVATSIKNMTSSGSGKIDISHLILSAN